MNEGLETKVYNKYFFNCNNLEKKNEYERVCSMYDKKLSECKDRFEKYRSWKAKHKKPTRLTEIEKLKLSVEQSLKKSMMEKDDSHEHFKDNTKGKTFLL